VIGTPLVAAAVAALVWAAVIVLAAGRARPRPQVVFASLVAGACAAGVAGTTTRVIVGWLARGFGGEHASALGGMVAAPVVEEMGKLAALLVVAAVWGARDPHDGIIRGALVGTGFAFAENVAAFGFAALRVARRSPSDVYLRAMLGGPTHPLFSAIAGAGVPYARGPRRTLALAGTPLVAILEHVLWNGAAAPALSDVLCDAATAGGPCRLVPELDDLALRAPAIAALGLAPAVAALAVLTRRRSRSP
jgi:RsiW-degrading membrane proteinase PrsW (M82 family)